MRRLTFFNISFSRLWATATATASGESLPRVHAAVSPESKIPSPPPAPAPLASPVVQEPGRPSSGPLRCTFSLFAPGVSARVRVVPSAVVLVSQER